MIAGRLIYPHRRSGVDRQSRIGVGRPGLRFCEGRDFDYVIFRDVDVGWSLTNVEVPDARRLNPMVRKASIWSYGKIWLVGGGFFITGGMRR